MFVHYLKTSVRSLRGSRFFSLLNISGLALSMAGCLLIYLWISDERSFDRFNEKADRIYRLNTELKFGATATERAIAPPPAAAAAKKTFPEVEDAVRLLPGNALIKKDAGFIPEERVASADPSFFNVFSFPLLSGNPATVLTRPGTIVISESVAIKYFGRTNVVGEGLSFMEGDKLIVHQVTGVMKDMPANSHFQFDLLVSMVDNDYSKAPDFATITPFSTYLLLKKAASVQKVASGLPAFMRANLPFYDALEKGDYMRFSLTPLTKIHLESARMNELGENGSLQYVNIFTLSGLLILFVACFNFMNLSTARSGGRAREVGVRKVLGSSRLALIGRFLTESMLLTAAALLLAWILAWAMLPAFNQVSGKNLGFGLGTILRLVPVTIALFLMVGLAAGAYAAFFLSGFRPIEVLKGNIALGMKGRGLRDYLVVFQFAISIFLVLCTMVVYRQLNYIHNKNLGFDRNEVLVVKNMNSLTESQARFLKESIGKMPGAAGVAMSSFLPAGTRRWSNFIASTESGSGVQTEFWPVDNGYIPCLEIEMAAGRNFSREFSSDSNGVIINEAAIKALGFKKDEVIGKSLYYQHDKVFHIIGVTKDFNFNTMKEAVSPAMLLQLNDWSTKLEGDGADNLLIRLRSAQASPVISNIAARWKAFGAVQPFSFSFLDADFDALYKGEERMAGIFVRFTILGLVIACLGLFGLAAFAAEQRGREIGIRKVLGASVPSILVLLSIDFVRLIIISMVIGIPLAWIAIGHWLQDFAYRAEIPVWLPVLAGATALGIALCTVTAQSLRAARQNPVRQLRSE